MIDDELFMQQIQEILSSFRLHPVDGNLRVLAGEVDAGFIRITIPKDFPDSAPGITINGTPVPVRYSLGMNLAGYINSAITAVTGGITALQTSVPPADFLPEERYMGEVQQVLSQHPEFSPVEGDLRHLMGIVKGVNSFNTINILIPENFPDAPAVISSSGENAGTGTAGSRLEVFSGLSDTINRIKSSALTFTSQPFVESNYSVGNPLGDNGSLDTGADNEPAVDQSIANFRAETQSISRPAASSGSQSDGSYTAPSPISAAASGINLTHAALLVIAGIVIVGGIALSQGVFTPKDPIVGKWITHADVNDYYFDFGADQSGKSGAGSYCWGGCGIFVWEKKRQ
jgi:hypothetical protein